MITEDELIYFKLIEGVQDTLHERQILERLQMN